MLEINSQTLSCKFLTGFTLIKFFLLLPQFVRIIPLKFFTPNTDIKSKPNTTSTNSVYGAMQDGYVERFDQKISPRPSFPKRGITISPFGKGGIRGIL